MTASEKRLIKAARDALLTAAESITWRMGTKNYGYLARAQDMKTTARLEANARNLGKILEDG